MRISTVVSVGRGPFACDATYSFTKDLGAVADADREFAGQVRDFIERVKREPYDPQLVRECRYVSERNDLFRYCLKHRAVISWEVKPLTRKGQPLSIRNEDWRILFIKFKSVDC